jgi:hypothetical protein
MAGATTALEKARNHAGAAGRREVDLALLGLDLQLERADSFRVHANAILAEMPEPPADDLLWMMIVSGYIFMRQLQGNANEALKLGQWQLDTLGSRVHDNWYSAAATICRSAMQLAYYNLDRMDEFLDFRQALHQSDLAVQEREHAGSLLGRAQGVETLLLQGRLDAAEQAANEIDQQLDKLLGVDPRDARVRFVKAKLLLARCGIAERRQLPGLPPAAAEALRILAGLHQDVGNVRVDIYYFRILLLTGRRAEARAIMASLLDRGVREQKFLSLARAAGLDPQTPPVDWKLDLPPWLAARLEQALAQP